MGGRGRAVARDAPSRVPEICIVALVTVFIAWTLRETHAPEALALVGLGAASIAADVLLAWAPAPGARPGVDASATLSVLVLPWTFAARTAGGLTSRDKFTLWTLLVAGAVGLARDATPRRVLADASRPVVVATVALFSSAAASLRLVENRERSSMHVHAALAACVLVHALPAVALASRLPRLFPNILSRAESALAAQAAVLAVGDAFAAAVAQHVTTTKRIDWLPTHFLDKKNDAQLLVLFATLTACALFAAAPPPANVLVKQTHAKRGPAATRQKQSPEMKNAQQDRWPRVFTRFFPDGGDTRVFVSSLFIVVTCAWFVVGVNGGDAFTKTLRKMLLNDRNATRNTLALWTSAFLGTSLLNLLTRNATVSVTTHRKKFHVLAAVLFAPPLVFCRFGTNAERKNKNNPFVSKETLAVAYASAFFIFAACEVIRTRRVVLFRVPVGAKLDLAFNMFLDHRDRGGTNLVLCHVSLLLAVAAPLWALGFTQDFGAAFDFEGTGIATPTPDTTKYSPFQNIPDTSQHTPVQVLGPLAGVVTIGLGDTFASVVGTRWGRNAFCRGSKKTREGAFAFFLATALSSYAAWRVTFRATDDFPAPPPKTPVLPIAVASLGSAWLESATEQMDNAFVPLAFLALMGSAGRVFPTS
jgi:CDP-diglyceride synthetase